MGWYSEHVAPHLIAFACGRGMITRERAKIVPQAEGVVLEIGAGGGHNVALYDPGKVTRLFALEPSAGMRRRGDGRLAAAPFPAEWLDAPGEAIPLEAGDVDTVVVTYTLCSIGALDAALNEARRVLKPTGRLVFLEHGLAPDPGPAAWQRRIQPVWGPLAAGCQLGRDIPGFITANGFAMEHMDAGYMPGAPRFAGYTYAGTARPR